MNGWGRGPGNGAHQHFELFGMQLEGFGMPTMFVAVIFASMATSVPDTVMSIRDARDGDYDDAVANALGSNIFDVCFALEASRCFSTRSSTGRSRWSQQLHIKAAN